MDIDEYRAWRAVGAAIRRDDMTRRDICTLLSRAWQAERDARSDVMTVLASDGTVPLLGVACDSSVG